MHEALDIHRIGTVFSINVSNGGVPKKAVAGAKVSLSGLAGDAHEDTIGHGGLERAVCIYSVERIRALQKEGHPIEAGTVGENLTIEGIDWDLVVPGAQLRVGDEVVLEVASFTNPCKTIKRSFSDEKSIGRASCREGVDLGGSRMITKKKKRKIREATIYISQ